MEIFLVPLKTDEKEITVEVRDYHHDGEHECKFEAFLENEFIASFEPDSHGILHICRDAKKVSPDVLDEICTSIEKYHWPHLTRPF